MNNPLKEDAAIRLRRLHFRSNHRGCKETDLLLGQFAEIALPKLDAAGLAAYAAFLDENDADIWAWLAGASAPPRADYEPILHILREYPRHLQ